MKALWIRVEARKVSSLAISRLADALGISCVHALGHYTALGGELAEHTDDGYIADVGDSTLERWAQWTGKRGAFAAAVREIMQDEHGTFDEWPETMGQLVKRRERDRERKRLGNSEDTPGNLPGNSTESGRVSVESRRVSAATERNGTERDGTVRDLDLERSQMRSGMREGPNAAAAPLAGANSNEQLPRAAGLFVEEFYGDASPKRRADVVQQLIDTLHDGARLDRKTRIKAGSIERLGAKCREVIAAGVRDRSKAMRVLLLKLGDTSDGSAPGVAVEARAKSDERKDDGDLAAAEAWLLDRPAIAKELERQLDVDGWTTSDEFSAMSRQIARRTLVLGAWRESTGAPDPELARASG